MSLLRPFIQSLVSWPLTSGEQLAIQVFVLVKKHSTWVGLCVCVCVCVCACACACVRACVRACVVTSLFWYHSQRLKCRTATYFICSCSQRIFNYCLGDYLGNILKKPYNHSQTMWMCNIFGYMGGGWLNLINILQRFFFHIESAFFWWLF